MRPARLFTLLGSALPPARGWGAVFFDAAGRPVAWAGEAAGLEAERGAATAGFVVSYHVTRVFLGWVSPRGENGARGTLVVTRRYPTGIIRPDLVEYLGLTGGPTPLRLRLKAAETRDRLFTFFVEPARPRRRRERRLAAARAARRDRPGPPRDGARRPRPAARDGPRGGPRRAAPRHAARRLGRLRSRAVRPAPPRALRDSRGRPPHGSPRGRSRRRVRTGRAVAAAAGLRRSSRRSSRARPGSSDGGPAPGGPVSSTG